MIIWLLISLAVSTHAESPTPAELSGIVKGAFGPLADKVDHIIQQKKISSSEVNVQSGDVIVYFMTNEVRRELQHAQIPDMPESYRRAQQGFNHVAMVAKAQDNPYIIASPLDRDRICQEFRGSKAYILVRPKSNVVGNRDRFEKGVDELSSAFWQLGYGYNTVYRTSAFHWTPEAKARLRGQLGAWMRNPETNEKPMIPDQYCSELPVTIHKLLGIDQKRSITLGQLIDIGSAAEIKNGKTPEQVVRETVDGIVNSMRSGAGASIKAYGELLAEHKQKGSDPSLLSYLEKQLKEYEQFQFNVENASTDLEEALSAKLGVPFEDKTCKSCRKGPIQRLKENLRPILTRMKALYFQIALNRKIMRPVDFIHDALDKNGNYEIVGFYAGDMPSSCN